MTGPHWTDIAEWWTSPALAYVKGLHDGYARCRDERDAEDDAVHRAAVRRGALIIARADARNRPLPAGNWPGLANGGVLPSADWVPDTSALTANADQALAVAANYPPMRTWTEVRASVSDRVWACILDDLTPRTRSAALAEVEHSQRGRAGAA